VHRIGCRSGSPPAKRFRSCDKPWPRDGSVWPRARLPGVRCLTQESRLRKASTSHVTSSRRRLLDRGRGRLFCGLDGAIARVNEGEGGAELRLRLLPRFADVLCAAEAPAMIAVDIPIGLPAPAGRCGPAAENMVRPLLGERQSFAFSVPFATATQLTVLSCASNSDCAEFATRGNTKENREFSGGEQRSTSGLER
jgi:Protein of unknown function (DUF429)